MPLSLLQNPNFGRLRFTKQLKTAQNIRGTDCSVPLMQFASNGQVYDNVSTYSSALEQIRISLLY
jgi:hypothetical protein